jgi:hypothetical protein
MGTITKLNDVLCVNISKVADVLKANVSMWDDNTFCPGGSPTPTPTITPTPTPTPVCTAECCPADLCYSRDDCRDACQCNDVQPYYLHLPCGGDCLLSNADGIFTDNECLELAAAGYYVDSSAECWYWDGSSSLSFDTNCR